jgi:hypothetical protein
VLPVAACGSFAGVTSAGEAEVSGAGELCTGFVVDVCAKVLHKQKRTIMNVGRICFITIFIYKITENSSRYKSS